MKEFFQKYGGYVVGGVCLIALGYVLITDDGEKDDQPRSCYSISRDRINAWLGRGWNVPGNANYTQSLVFEKDGTAHPYGIKITAWRKIPDQNDCEQGIDQALYVEIGEDCRFGNWEEEVNSYFIDPARDIADDGSFNSDLYIIPRENPDPKKAGMLAFEIDFFNGGSYSRMALTKPCPPFCPRPE